MYSKDVDRFGNYLLVDSISTGGMAEIFLARELNKAGEDVSWVAIKRILPQVAEDQDFQAMFFDEAKISTSLNHPNIGSVYEFGFAEESYFLAMEYIHGKDIRAIRARLAERKRHMSVSMALYIASRICAALEHAHQQKNEDGDLMRIIHRDVSPANVLITYDGAVKLIDFGIAHAKSRIAKTHAGRLKGKVAYLSPEQILGKPIDHRADLFSCGTLLFEMLTHRRPFRGDDDLKVMQAIREARFTPPSTINTDVPLAVDKILKKALAKSPEERFQSAVEMQHAIEHYLQRVGRQYASKDLSAWMLDAFRDEYEQEKTRLNHLKEVNLPEQGGLEKSDTQLNTDKEIVTDSYGLSDTLRNTNNNFVPQPIDEIGESMLSGEQTQPNIVNNTGDTVISHIRPPIENDEDAETELSFPPDFGDRGDNLPQDTAIMSLSHENSIQHEHLKEDTEGLVSPIEQEDSSYDGLSSGQAEIALSEKKTIENTLHKPRRNPIYASEHSSVAGGVLVENKREPDFVDARTSGVEVDDLPVERYIRDDHLNSPTAEIIDPSRIDPTLFAQMGSRKDNRLLFVAIALLAVFFVGVVLVVVIGGSGKNKRKKAVGSLFVTTTNNATCTVRMDDKVLGVMDEGATLKATGIVVGEHLVELRCTGYAPHKEKIRIVQNELSLIDAKLKKE